MLRNSTFLLMFFNSNLIKMSEIFKLKTKGDNINKIVYEGFSYTIQHKQKDSKKIKCKCDAVLCKSKNFSNPILIKEHNHVSDKNTLEVEKFKCNIKNLTKLYDRPSQIFAKAVSDLPDNILMNIPHESAVKRVIQKQRSNLNPLKPTSLEDLKIEDDWSLYEGRHF
ncbi:unnamed protein product [Aphis gossypii]|uniref:FLYWCH-type domain-containing protein n=1 Tax=Aphis gossypii TaxID=80765 RepID=A0A9P0IUD6_APHGO|nr:unnamed protein product [Aphis gossypii]